MKRRNGWAVVAKFEGEFFRTTNDCVGQGTVKLHVATSAELAL
jgi:hypothetical protein